MPIMKTILFWPLLVSLVTGYAPYHNHRHNAAVDSQQQRQKQEGEDLVATKINHHHRDLRKSVAMGLFGLSLMVATTTALPAFAADYAKKDISGQDFSGQVLSNKDFTGATAKGTSFAGSDLRGAKFAKANLVNADFSGADLRGANFEDSVWDGANLKNANAQNAVFSKTFLDIGNLEGTDMTNSLWPSKFQVMICDRDDLKAANPTTNVYTYDSIMCPGYLFR